MTDYNDSPGQELASYWKGVLSTKGALSGQESDQRDREISELSEGEKKVFSLFWEKGFCQSCAVADIASPAGHGDHGEYCSSCAEELA